MEAGPSRSSGPTTRSKKRKNTGTNDDSQASLSFSDAHDKEDLCPWVLVNPDIPVKAVQDQLQRKLEVQISMSKAFRAKAKAKREIKGDHCLGDDIDLHPNSNFTFISDRQNGIIPAIKIVYPSRAKSDLLLNNIYDVFNGKIVRGRDKLVITLLEYIRKRDSSQERERKARTTLLMALPEDHLAKFHKMTDAKEMWDAIKSRFGGNDESKKMQKYILKQQFEGFSVSNTEGLHKGYDKFQSLLSKLGDPWSRLCIY
ncbi:hypothetical protein Tco_0435421 [Tanacetum coccineum]